MAANLMPLIDKSEVEYGSKWTAAINTKDVRQIYIAFDKPHSTVPKTILFNYGTYCYFYGNLHIDTNDEITTEGFTLTYIPSEIGNGLAGLRIDWVAIW